MKAYMKYCTVFFSRNYKRELLIRDMLFKHLTFYTTHIYTYTSHIIHSIYTTCEKKWKQVMWFREVKRLVKCNLLHQMLDLLRKECQCSLPITGASFDFRCRYSNNEYQKNTHSYLTVFSYKNNIFSILASHGIRHIFQYKYLFLYNCFRQLKCLSNSLRKFTTLNFNN